MFELVLFVVSLLDSYNISCLHGDSSRVFAGTYGGGVYEIELKDFLLKKMDDSAVACPYVSSMNQKNGWQLVGTFNGFSCLGDDGRLLYFYVSPDYYERFITSVEVFEDLIVLGTPSGLVLLKNGMPLKRLLGLPVSCLLRAGDSLLIGTIEGLHVMRRDLSVEKILSAEGESCFPVKCLLEDSGWIWIGLEDYHEGYSPGGLYLFGGDELLFRIDVFSGLKYYGISSLCKIGDSLFIASYAKSNYKTAGFLQIMHGGVLSDFDTKDDNVSGALINDMIFIPKRNELWLATQKGIVIHEIE
ncbi:hypothetical protein JW890_09065 [candidate division WOR-3 bacterium]|nr:hypothetical protein [candidate division WOR-3 bacterium]